MFQVKAPMIQFAQLPMKITMVLSMEEVNRQILGYFLYND
jgi:hypothetical protein